MFGDQRIRIISHETNRGSRAARNTAIEKAKGRWIALIDADDLWHEDRLITHVDEAINCGGGHFVADEHVICFETEHGLVTWGSVFKKLHHIPFTDGKIFDFRTYMKYRCPIIKPLVPLAPIMANNLRYNPTCLTGEDMEL